MTNFARARAHMVQSQLLTNGVVNPELVDLYMNMPREAFLPQALAPRAYLDGAIMLADGSVILEPLVEARMLQAAAAHTMARVLVIGSASVAAIALLASLAGQVYVVDDNAQRLATTKDLLSGQGIKNVITASGAPQDGLPQYAPYNAIFIMGAVCDVPESMKQQLVENGMFYTILKASPSAQGVLVEYIKSKHGGLTRRDLANASTFYHPAFMPKQEFVF